MLVAAVVSMLVAGFVTVTQAEQPAAAVPAACDPAAVMNHRLGELGRSDYAWTISPLPARIGGLTDLDEHTVVISPLVTCDLMTAFVNHEWMHVQQGPKHDLSARVYQRTAHTRWRRSPTVGRCSWPRPGRRISPRTDRKTATTVGRRARRSAVADCKGAQSRARDCRRCAGRSRRVRIGRRIRDAGR
jgi:hypothetical protein